MPTGCAFRLKPFGIYPRCLCTFEQTLLVVESLIWYEMKPSHHSSKYFEYKIQRSKIYVKRKSPIIVIITDKINPKAKCVNMGYIHIIGNISKAIKKIAMNALNHLRI